MKYTESTTATSKKESTPHKLVPRRMSIMEVVPRQPPARRYSVALAPTSYSTSPSPSRYPPSSSSIKPASMGHEGTFRHSASPSCSSSSSSPPRSCSPEEKTHEAGARSVNLNARLHNRKHVSRARQRPAGAEGGVEEEGEGEGEGEEGEEGGGGGGGGGDLATTSTAPGLVRPRTYSLPGPHFRGLRLLPESCSGASPWRDVYTCPVRSFSRTTKGVVNRGDSVRKCSMSSLLSSASGSALADVEERQRAMSIASQDSVLQGAGQAQGPGQGPGPGPGQGQGQGVCGGVGVDGGADGALAPAYYRVAVLGTVEVGKSALCRQFLSSEYLGTYGDSCDGEDGPCIVSVMLDGEESMIEFTEGPTVSQEDESNYDAYIIVFSVTDRSSFDVAAFLLRHLRVEVGTDRAIIVVANKVDLVRQRRVTNSEARDLATTFDAKYTETSAALNDHVDDLLVGTLSQIRFQLCPPPTSLLTPPSSPKNKCRTPSPLSLFSRFVKYATRKSNSCDNLLLQ